MPAPSLAAKLKLRPNQRAGVIHAPADYAAELKPLPDGVDLATRLSGKFDWLQVFVKNKAELDALAPRAIAALKPGSLMWVTFPKDTSQIQTDLTRDRGWDALMQADLKRVTLVAINDTWSAFAFRPLRPGEQR